MERLICLLMFLGCSTGALGGQSACITGFTNNINNPRARKIPYEERRIIPGINFNCSGVIAAWTIRAKWRTDGMHTSFPHLQIWRKHGSDSTYFIARDTELFVSNGSSRSEGDHIFTGTLEPPLKFRAGDVLGMFQPPESRSRVGVYYASGRSPNYYIETGSAHQPPLASVIATGLSSNKIENGLPLVSVNAAPDATIMTSANSIAIVEKPYSISCRINTADSLNFMFNITWIAQNSSVVATLIGSGNILAHSFTASLNDAGPYVCRANVTSPDLDTPRVLSSTVNIIVQIPTPTLTMSRDPDASATLRHGDTLTLTCTIQLDPAVNSDVVVTGELSGPGGSASNPTKVSGRTYQIILMISSTHSSTYTCTATISGDINFATSKQGVSELDITVELTVTITINYNPPSGIVLGPNEYRAASGPVDVTCTAIGGTGSVQYQWSSTCRDCPFNSSTSNSIRRGAVHSGDTGIHTCTAATTETSGSVNITFNVIGAGIHVFVGVPNGPLPNNGLVSLIPNHMMFRLRLFCRSDSMMENVGIFIGLDGSDIVAHKSYSFFEVFNSQPGQVSVENFVANSTILTASGQGVYTCRIPLQSGKIKEINIGIYPSGFSANPGIINLVFTLGASSSNLTCTSTGSPATNVTWMRDGLLLSIDGNTYQLIQTVTDRFESTYENVLIINENLSNVIKHRYVCNIANVLGAASSSINLTAPLSITNLTFVLGAGTSTLTCTSTGSSATSVKWWKDGQLLIIDGITYQLMQSIINGAESTYENVLIIRDTLSKIVNHTYTCNVENLLGRASKNLNIIALTVYVTISYTPPPDVVLGPNEYRAASGPVTATCTVMGASGPVSYQWSSTCRKCSFQTSTKSQVHVAAAHSGDTGTHTCTTTDQTGNTGNASIEFSTVGVGIRTLNGLPTGFLSNNSLVVADNSSNSFHIRFLCLSSSMESNAGLFIGPRKNFIMTAGPFNIVDSRPGELQTIVFPNNTLTPRDHGIYTCRILLESGEVKEINIGIYSIGFRTPPRITKFVFIPGSSSSTLICTSTGSPATTVSWMRDGQHLTIDGNAYQMTQIVTNRTASTYDSILTIYNQLSSIIQHRYVCSISNILGTVTSNLDLTAPIVTITQSGDPIAREPFSLSCSVVVANTTPEIGKPVIEISGPPDINFVHIKDFQMADSSVKYIHTVDFGTLQASHAGKYLCQANFSLLTVTDEVTLSVTISAHQLNLTRYPDYNVTLRHGDPLNLTCTIQLDTAINRDVVVTGTLSGPGGTTRNPTIVSNRMYQMILTIPSLPASSLVTYSCASVIKPAMSNTDVLASKEHYKTLNISVELRVIIAISYTPPPGVVLGPSEYRAASGLVNVTCMAEGGQGNVNYQWSSTCRDCPFQETKPESMQSSITRGATHSGDTGTHTCNVTKGGNVGSASIDFNIVGAGIHIFNGLPKGSVPNNGLAVADDIDPRFRIRAFCRSDSMKNNVGDLIGPEGNIIRTSDPFNISHSQPGELGAIVLPNTNLTQRYQGIYTCRIPLASRVVNDINIGFYPSGFRTYPTITSVIFSMDSSSSTLTCTSTGSPATNVTWTIKNGLYLTMTHGDSINVNMINYQLVQTVISRRNSTYTNTLIINTTSVGDITRYRCEVMNVLGRNTKGIELGVTILAADAARLGEDYTLTCRVSGISNTIISFEWLGPGIARRTGHSQLSLGPLALSNAGNYTCIATVSALNLTFTESEETIIAIPSPTVRVKHDGGSPIFSGSVLTLTCTITLDENVVQYANVLIVTSRWYGPHGHLMNGTEIAVTSAVGSSTDGQYTSTAVLTTIKDAGTYSCQATVRHSTSRFVVAGMNTNETVIDIQAPHLLISVTPNTTRLPNVSSYNTFSLTCTVTVPEGVVSPKTFMWWRKNAVMNTDLTEIHSNEAMNITYSTLEQPVSSSMLTVTETTVGVWEYLCKVVLNNIENTSDEHSIHVIGPAGPNSPTYFVASTITTNSATICLFIPFIMFTPETYVVHYGTSMTTVDSISAPVESTNFTAKDFKVSIMLTALTPDTMYFYFINASNTETSVISPTETFMTQEVSSSDSTTAKITGSVAGVTLLVVLGIVVVVIVFVRKHSSRHGNHTTNHVDLHKVAKEEEPGSQRVECVAYHQVKHRHGSEPIGTEHSESVEHPKDTESPVYENVSRKLQSPATDSPAENVYEVMVSV